MMFPWCVANDDKKDQSMAIFPCIGIIFLCLPSTAGYDAMHSSNGTGIDGACLSASKTNRLDTGLKKTPSAPGQDRAETVGRADKRCAIVEGALRTYQGAAKAGNR
jgi:hypothetical protein